MINNGQLTNSMSLLSAKEMPRNAKSTSADYKDMTE